MRWLLACLLVTAATTEAWKAHNDHDVEADPEPEAFFHYKTRPDIEAPRWTVEVYDEAALQQGDYYWFVSPYAHLRQRKWPMWNGPHIYRNDGDLIWAGASFGDYFNAHDFRMSYVEGGKQALSVMYPKLHENSHGLLLDETYEPYQGVNARSDLSGPNMHEFNLVDDGKHALVVIGPNHTAIQLDEEDYSGPCQIGWQGFGEVDVATNDVLFAWYAQDFVTYTETSFVQQDVEDTLAAKCNETWDIMHINSVDKFENGDYLISARHADTLYRISHIDQSIVWRLGGRWSDFVPQSDLATFSRQHHARIRAENDTHIFISLFNNAAGDQDPEKATSEYSSGLMLALDIASKPMKVDVAHQYIKPIWQDVGANNSLVVSRGSMDFLPNGNVFLGWVNSSHISEHTPDGRLLMQAVMMKEGANSYRSYKMPWTGRPAQPPDVVVERGKDAYGKSSSMVYVSWNGATDVARWNILPAGGESSEADVLVSAPRKTFETALILKSNVDVIIAVAVDKDGQELGRSEEVEIPWAERTQHFTNAAPSAAASTASSTASFRAASASSSASPSSTPSSVRTHHPHAPPPRIDHTTEPSEIDASGEPPRRIGKPKIKEADKMQTNSPPTLPPTFQSTLESCIGPKTFYFWISIGFIIGFGAHQYFSRKRKLPWIMSLR